MGAPSLITVLTRTGWLMSLAGKQVLIKHDGLPVCRLLLLIISAVLCHPCVNFLSGFLLLDFCFFPFQNISLNVHLADCCLDWINSCPVASKNFDLTGGVSFRWFSFALYTNFYPATSQCHLLLSFLTTRLFFLVCFFPLQPISYFSVTSFSFHRDKLTSTLTRSAYVCVWTFEVIRVVSPGRSRGQRSVPRGAKGGFQRINNLWLQRERSERCSIHWTSVPPQWATGLSITLYLALWTEGWDRTSKQH